MARRSDPRITKYVARGRDRWRAIADAGTDPATGKRRQVKRSFASRAAAEQFLRELDDAAASGSFVARDRITFDALCDQWLAAKRATVRAGTIYGYESALRAYREAIGTVEVQRVTFQQVEAVVLSQVAAGRTKRTVQYNLGVARQVFARAVRTGLISTDPSAYVATGGKESAAPTAFTEQEMRRLAFAIEGHEYPHGFALTLIGLRRSEVLGLVWSDLIADDNGVRLSISRSRAMADRKTTAIGDTKTRRGTRVLPLDRRTASILLAERKASGGIAQAPIVADAFGLPLRPEIYSDSWHALCVKAGVRPLDLRAARRSAVTAMRGRGIADHVVAAFAGHDEAVMRRHYSVALDDALADAASTLGEVFGEVS